jgi:hypothetical protein
VTNEQLGHAVLKQVKMKENDQEFKMSHVSEVVFHYYLGADGQEKLHYITTRFASSEFQNKRI